MIIIPARLESTRFPKKVLADINGLPMVIATVKAVEDIDEVVVATDSKEVVDICKRFKVRSVLTHKNHKSGTDRINEAATRLGLDEDEIVLNIQADEPFIEGSVVLKLKELVQRSMFDENVMICSAYKTITEEEALNPNQVKVVTDENDFALYFSRSKIPFLRDKGFLEFKGHLGVYGFRKKMLNRFCLLPASKLENSEKLEQLRALSHGFKIAMCKVESKSFGIDTVDDLNRALKHF